MKVLLSGFEPFDGDQVNSSQEMLVWIEKESWPFEISIIILPVEFEKSFENIKEKILIEKPDLVLAMGLAKKRTQITIERRAVNLMDARIPDQAGFQPSNLKISHAGEKYLSASWCPENLPLGVGHSDSAGEYVCNYLFYKLLEYFSKLKIGFIHLPVEPDKHALKELILLSMNLEKTN